MTNEYKWLTEPAPACLEDIVGQTCPFKACLEGDVQGPLPSLPV